MRAFKELINAYDKIWLMVDDNVADNLYQELCENGFKMLNGDELERRKVGGRMGLVASTKTIGYISGICWHEFFRSPNAVLNIDDNRGADIVVNYRSFISGDESYAYKFASGELSPP